MDSRIDYVPLPPAHFPLRDLLVLEQLPLGPADVACEIGVGSGATAARLAKLCGSVTGIEISESTVDALRYLERRIPNLRFLVADVCRPGALALFERRFSRVVSCDTLEHVNDPAAFFRAVAALVTPSGQFLVTFPNEPSDRMHGVTRFDSVAALGDLVAGAGLQGFRIGAAHLSRPARRVADRYGWGPIRLARRILRGRHESDGCEPAAHPQTFDATFFGRHLRALTWFAPVLNLYWYGVLKLMWAAGPAFEIDWGFKRLPFTEAQVLIVGGGAQATSR